MNARIAERPRRLRAVERTVAKSVPHHRPTAPSVRVLAVDEAGPPAPLANDGDFEVTTVESVECALDLLADDGRAIDCVVSEYELSESDGIDLLETVRDDQPNLPFVFLTGAGDEQVASEAIGKGATDYLPKSVDGKTLCNRVQRAVATTTVEADSGLSGDRMRELTNAFPDSAFILDENGRYLEVLSGPSTEDLRTVSQEQLVGRRIHDVFPEAKADQYLSHIERTLETGTVETMEYETETTMGSRWYEGRTAPLGEPIDGRDAVVWVARDITDRRAGERRLAEHSDELATLNRVNDLINNILQSLVGSATREEIERTVCEQLANSDFYRFAWVGTPWTDGDGIRLNCVEGAERGPVERLVETTTSREEGDSISHVVEQNTPVVVPDIEDEPRINERERELMAEIGMASAILVPVIYGDTNYGVLGVAGTRTGAFSDRERTAFEVLGEIVGFAINAVKNRQLLHTDTSVQLEFLDTNSDKPLRRVSEKLGCRFELKGTVPVADDLLIQYVAVERASPKKLVERANADDSVESARVVTDGGDSGLVELVLGSSGIERLLDLGTAVKSAVTDDGEIRMVAEAPPDTDVREIVDAYRSEHPDTELVGKREVSNTGRKTQEYRRPLTETLTDKQLTALRAAYFAGYYEYPRDSTAQEVAESLDISSPTLHQHLQAAERKILTSHLDS